MSAASGKIIVAIVGAVLLALAWVLLGLLLTRLHRPANGPVPIFTRSQLPEATETLRVLTWNIGYGGLGSDATFVADGGKDFMPASQEIVARNIDAIGRVLRGSGADVMLLQEISTGSMLNRWYDVLRSLGTALPHATTVVSFDVTTVGLPPPLKVEHGKAIFSQVGMDAAVREPLPLEDDHILGVLRHHYGVLRSEHRIAGSPASWVVLNIHLSAFDEDASARRAQLAEVLRIAQSAFKRGNAVIIGGDFNMEFVRDRFPSTEPIADRFWLFDFPAETLPEGWRAAFPLNAPTARTLVRPFSEGDTYTTVIDGFVISPNVEIVDVEALNLGFANSDHQPVSAQFAIRSGN